MPFLSMVRRAWLDTRSFTQRFSAGTQNLRSCRFGSQRRLVLLLACDTLLPLRTLLPVTWHTRAMMLSSDSAWPAEYRPGGYITRCRKVPFQAPASRPRRRPHGGPAKNQAGKHSRAGDDAAIERAAAAHPCHNSASLPE